MKTRSLRVRPTTVLAALALPCVLAQAQTAPAPSATKSATPAADEDVVVMSPFEVTADKDEGYSAATTLAGNRLRTELRDVGSAVSVVTGQFLKDTGAANNSSLLTYMTGTEVGGVYGNFAGVGDAATLNEDTVRPNENTRVRGLAAADNTRDYFRTEIPWDAYNIDRVEIQRGPNSILFGQGSPAGIINAGTKGASFRNSGEVEARFGSYGSNRVSLDVNQVLLPHQLALRLDALRNQEKFQQKPAFSKDERVSGALRFEPAILNKNGARTILKAGFESGRINSNNPRELPPVDYLTPWFGTGANGVNQATYSGMQLWDHLSGRINHGQARDAGYAAPNSGPIPYASPWIANANFGTSSGTEPVAFFGANGTPALWITEVSAQLQSRGIGPTGATDGDIGGFVAAPGRMRGLNGTALWAAGAKLPYSSAGIFKNNVITDPSIFNFNDQLIDGDTKREWQKFHTANASLAQTFFDDKFGFALDANKEHYDSGQVALLGGSAGLYIDPMAVFADGTPDAGRTGDPFADGTPNPNVGRPFVSSTGGSNYSFASDREAKRLTGFFTHDFAKNGEKTWLNRLLGSHTVTGLLADDKQTTDTRSWQRYGYFGDTAYAIQHLDPATNAFNAPGMVPTSIVYLGGSLKGKSATGANIPSIAGMPTISSGAVRYFDDHWKWTLNPAGAGYVNPAAPWTNYFYTGDASKLAPGQPGNPGAMVSTQSENPANYVGWTTAQLNVTDSEAGNRDKLTTSASLRKSVTSSQAIVWQGKLLDNSIVGTYGWRKDVAKSWSYDSLVGAGNKQIDFTTYKLPEATQGRVQVQSRAYSIVGHLMDLPGLKNVTKDLPFEVSLSYNMSTNFKPDASRVDVYGESIASPAGKTIDKGITIATRDGRYSLKVNRYVTAVTNATSPGSYGFGYDLGNWMGHGAAYANVFEYDIGNWEWVKSASNYRVGNAMRFDFFTNNQPDTTGDEAKAIAGYRAFQKKVDPRFWKAWGFQSLAYVQSGAAIPLPGEVHVPAGFSITEDTISKGWEIELNAEPIQHLRLSLNASKASAVRNNIGGAHLKELTSLIATAVQGDAGRLHFWWGTDDVPRAKDTWYNYLNNPGAQWASRALLEGTNVPELREWRVNAVANYDFTSGFLKDVNVGGGLRYQSSVTIGYPPTGNPNDPATLGFDLANPYKGPSETNFDFWVGYHRRLTDSVNWRIQLNVRNAFQDDELIPITVQGPIPGKAAGSAAAYRIAPTQSFFVTNTFSF